MNYKNRDVAHKRERKKILVSTTIHTSPVQPHPKKRKGKRNRGDCKDDVTRPLLLLLQNRVRRTVGKTETDALTFCNLLSLS